MRTYPFYSVATHLKTFFGIDVEDDDLENIGLHAWDKIGNKQTGTYHYDGMVTNGELQLPCNADIIEMITSGREEYQRTDNVQVDNFSRLEIENYIEAYKTQGKSYYARGGMIPYTRTGDVLLFNTNISRVHIIYKGVVLDNEGLPYLNFKEVEAIATYCAYVITNKKGMTTRDQATMQIAQLIKVDWQRLCDNARTPIELNQNDMNDILDAQGSWDRKRHGVSFKLYQ